MNPKKVPVPDDKPTPRERALGEVLHWTSIIVVIVATTILGLHQDLDSTTIGTVYGIAMGHVGTVAHHWQRSR